MARAARPVGPIDATRAAVAGASHPVERPTPKRRAAARKGAPARTAATVARRRRSGAGLYSWQAPGRAISGYPSDREILAAACTGKLWQLPVQLLARLDEGQARGLEHLRTPELLVDDLEQLRRVQRLGKEQTTKVFILAAFASETMGDLNSQPPLYESILRDVHHRLP